MTAFATTMRAAVSGRGLDEREMEAAIGAIMDGAWSSVQAAGFLGALATRRETANEILGAAIAMRDRALRVPHELPLVMDVVGSGGDGAGTINISTAAALVVAAADVPVAKHGNRAASSKCGSADVLEALGVDLERAPDAAARRLRDDGFVFLFAPRYHPAMRAVGPVRRELGVRTLFNILGPLTNPARATHQVVGVANDDHVVVVGEALRGLGLEAGAVVHARSGIDEIAGEGPTSVYRFDASGERRYEIDPADFGVRAPLAAIAGGDAAENAAALRAIVAGERSPRADLVALNAALPLEIAGRVADLREGFALACELLRNGAAMAKLEAIVRSESAG